MTVAIFLLVIVVVLLVAVVEGWQSQQPCDSRKYGADLSSSSSFSSSSSSWPTTSPSPALCRRSSIERSATWTEGWAIKAHGGQSSVLKRTWSSTTTRRTRLHHHSPASTVEPGDFLETAVAHGAWEASSSASPFSPTLPWWEGWILHNPIFWSVMVMLSIVALLTTWERSVETLREESPPAVRSVLDQVLGEMGGLGFIGLILSVALSQQVGFGQIVGAWSEEFLGEKDVLLELFEFLHETFFETAMLFFATAAYIVLRVLATISQVTQLAQESIRENCLQVYNGPADPTPETANKNFSDAAAARESPVGYLSPRLPQLLQAELLPKCAKKLSMQEYEAMMFVNQRGRQAVNPLVREITMTTAERGAEVVILRERLRREMNLPDHFSMEQYLEEVFSSNKLNLVKVQPSSWIPLIPAIALANAVDLYHDVATPNSPQASLASGFFFSTSWVVLPSVALQALCLGWCLWNFHKMATIKAMLLPTLVREDAADEALRLLPPAVENSELRAAFVSSKPLWGIMDFLESFFAKPATNRVEELFGKVGAAGPDLYLNSIKFQTWLSVSSIVFFASQILPRDIAAFLHPEQCTVGDPAHLIPEMILYGGYALLNFAELSLVPTTFLNYCLVTCVEDMVKTEPLENSILRDVLRQRNGTDIEGFGKEAGRSAMA